LRVRDGRLLFHKVARDTLEAMHLKVSQRGKVNRPEKHLGRNSDVDYVRFSRRGDLNLQ